VSQRKTSAGFEAKRVVGNPAAGSSQMAGELGELKRRFNSALVISARFRQYQGLTPQGHKSSHKTKRH
jgi:hypothetical protein